jgi:hypothetical protein
MRLLVLLVALSSFAHAEDDDDDVRERLRFLQSRLKLEAPSARAWTWGWVAFNGLALGVQSYRGATAGKLADRTDDFVSAGKAAVGLLSGALRPLSATRGDAELRGLPESSPSERRQKLALAERLLRRNAAEVDRRYSLLPHALNLALNIAGAAIVQGVSHDAGTAWLSAGIGVAVGELTIWTQPTRAKKDLREYENRFIGHYADTDLSLVPLGSLAPGSGLVTGAALQLRF